MNFRGNASDAFTRSIRRLAATALIMAGIVAPAGADEQTIHWSRATIAVPANAPRGFAEYQNSCTVCHGPMPERPGTRALAAKYQGTIPALLEERTDLQPEFIRHIVRNGISLMPMFRKTELSDAQLDDIVAYLTRTRP